MVTFLGVKPERIPTQRTKGKPDPKTGLEVDPWSEVDGEWRKGRTSDGWEGWIPKKWIEVLQRRKPESVEVKKVD